MHRWRTAALTSLALVGLLVACGDDGAAPGRSGDPLGAEPEDDSTRAPDDDQEAFSVELGGHAHPSPAADEPTNVDRLEELGKPADWQPAGSSTTRIGNAPNEVGRCPDAWVTDAVAQVVGVGRESVFGKACDPYLYGKARWSSFDQLRQHVVERFATHCGDRWVTLAIMTIYNRVPQAHDCNISLYGGGQWSDYGDLMNKVWAAYYTNPPPDPSWHVLVMIYTAGVQLPSFKGRDMTTAQIEDIKSTVNQVPGIARSISGGRANISRMDVVAITRPLNTLSPNGDTNKWVGPADVRGELDHYAPEGGPYDSVLVVFRNDDGTNKGPSMGGAGSTAMGLATGPRIGSAREGWRDGTNGAGFAMIALPENEMKLGNDKEKGYSVFLHEWLHQVEMTYWNHHTQWRDLIRECDKVDPKDGKTYRHVPLHCAENHGYAINKLPEPMIGDGYPGTAPYGWDAWYRAFMTGQIPNGSITDEMWRRGAANSLR
jgi:hypothetical protein